MNEERKPIHPIVAPVETCACGRPRDTALRLTIPPATKPTWYLVCSGYIPGKCREVRPA